LASGKPLQNDLAQRGIGTLRRIAGYAIPY
jgi:hypothetical protein